ncbi:nucleoside deaminase [Catalinimonas niigatensis]|uniref:nucleoside deaminase n=1 Tax=Catalinimonas niigatensis TaxID=1397264 RepID=UPI0026659A7B|nr:nucleoside deaminase [Catalinimonas niigatensis]WPP48495.1 nucleoside deaminase [Catalinimonas niigatensis]
MGILKPDDEYYMQQALRLAEQAYEEDEIPVGAIVVVNNRIIGKAYNQTEKLHDVTAHAEMLALTSAFNHLGAKYLPECTLYVTLEPCVMCAGAIHWAQIGTLVYAAPDEKKGFTKYQDRILHPRTQLRQGILAQESMELIQSFFRRMRGK